MMFKTFLRESETILIQIRYKLSYKADISTIIYLQNSYMDNLNKLCHFEIKRESSAKKKAVGQLLAKTINDVVELIKNGSYAQAYDLVDAFHCLPSVFLAHHYDIPNDYWEIYVVPYSNKWDASFSVEVKKMYPCFAD